MGLFTPTVDQAYLKYADLLLQHHRLLSENKDEADETMAVENEMTELWERLDAKQKRSLSGLGSDLNWIRREASPHPRGRTPEDATPLDYRALEQTKKNADWHGVLHYLRVCASKTPPLHLARLRAEAWQVVDLPAISRVFSDFAARLR
ncbi:MAG TPA: hypothetical protein DDY78_05560 [Planctomycetales bacterium]|jgi:hypothetical protein|nr:hypothetical protein [Planctomycetales bacterium]